MKKSVFLAGLLLASVSVFECKTARRPAETGRPLSASAETESLLNCCGSDRKMPDGNPASCEASAVLFLDGVVYVANDKDMPAGLSPVFSKPWAAFGDTAVQPAPLTAGPFLAAKKYEDFASNGEYVFLTTAFDRVKPGSTDWDAYNTILYWKKGDPAGVKVLAPEPGAATSVGFREPLSRVLAQNRPAFPNGMPYFKIEGLAVMDSLLLFGIREEGEKFDKFDYRTRIVAVPFSVQKTADGETIRLGSNWRIVADFDPGSVAELPKPLALSSLEYDRDRRLFWMLTSIEQNGRLDAYLWTATPDALLNNRPFTLVRDEAGRPVHFNHKAEDLTLLDRNHLLVIHDDDRTATPVGDRTRRPHQAAYTVLRVN
ncbi:hypothetical protein [Larkinella soli]|uniref:hypothetical protein n=1 Tax=Larkinella soli TaxID=1770527 RepID=UPI000FFC9090|nr:hypothetical protein [Larkinella soli]